MFGEWKITLESKSEFQVAVQILGEKKEESDWIRLDCEIRPSKRKPFDTGVDFVN